VSRGPHSFREVDITRAYRAAQKAGHPDAIVEYDIERKCVRIIPRKPGEVSTASEPNNDLDQWMAKHADAAEGR
jgi:hypothetical protein